MRKANDKYFIQLAKDRKMRANKLSAWQKEEIAGDFHTKIITGGKVKIGKTTVSLHDIQSYIMQDNDLASELNELEIEIVLNNKMAHNLRMFYYNATYVYIDKNNLVNKFLGER